MDQIKIGKFIAARRKNLGLTQAQLAEKLNITNRAVSKWETGKALPDSSIMIELCDVLRITVNDLLSGEVVTMDHYNQEMEKHLLEMIKQKEENDKKLLHTEIIMGIVTIVPCFTMLALAAYLQMQDWLRIVLIIGGLVPFLITCFCALRIEQIAGYYECQKCKHRHIPTYRNVLWAPHINRTRYMRCPKCSQRSWQKKVINKD